jgi:hypothetical protein
LPFHLRQRLRVRLRLRRLATHNAKCNQDDRQELHEGHSTSEGAGRYDGFMLASFLILLTVSTGFANTALVGFLNHAGDLQEGVLPSAQNQEPQEASFRSAQAGFLISTPEESWELQHSIGADGNGRLAMGPLKNGGLKQLSVTVSSAAYPDLEALRKQRDEILKQAQQSEDIRKGKKLKRKFGDLMSAGLQVEQDSAGQTFIARQYYLLSQGKQYVIQCHAPKGEFSDLEPLFEQALQSFAIVPLDGEALRLGQLQKLSAQCGSEVQWETEWKVASARARKEGKLIVVTVQAVSGFEVGDQIGRGPFMEQSVVKLLEHRFVVLRWHRGLEAPFVRQNVFGLGPSTFGTGILVTDAKGSVVKQIFIIKGLAVYDSLLETLKEQQHLSLQAPQPVATASSLERTRLLHESGQLIEAQILCESSPRVTEGKAATVEHVAWALLRAQIHATARQGNAARMEVRAGLAAAASLAAETSSGAGGSAAETIPAADALSLRHELQLLEAQLMTSMGEPEAAESQLDLLLALDEELAAETHAQALMLKGALRLQDKDRAGTETAWQILTDRFPETRWAWMAAAGLTGPGWKMEIFPDLRWPREIDRPLARVPKAADKSNQRATISALVNGAADFLLAQQSEDGSWQAMTSYGNRKPLADDLKLAATAIAGQALLHIPNNADTKQAAERAMLWLLAQRELREAETKPPIVFMDYAVWSRSYILFFLADCLERGIGNEQALQSEIKKCLQDLTVRQQGNGGWSYYLSGEVGGAAKPQSISFTTATVVLALERTAEIDLLEDRAMLDRGLDCLEAMRSPKGTFSYFLNGGSLATSARSGDGVEASAARGPVCGLALLRGDRETAEELAPRLKMYVEHLPAFGAQRRKALMHAGLHTQGSHYLLYDYATAAQALNQVQSEQGFPKALAKKTRAAVLREVRACLNADGSFTDNPLLGTTSATGLAVLALVNLVEN